MTLRLRPDEGLKAAPRKRTKNKDTADDYNIFIAREIAYGPDDVDTSDKYTIIGYCRVENVDNPIGVSFHELLLMEDLCPYKRRKSGGLQDWETPWEPPVVQLMAKYRINLCPYAFRAQAHIVQKQN